MAVKTKACAVSAKTRTERVTARTYRNVSDRKGVRRGRLTHFRGRHLCVMQVISCMFRLATNPPSECIGRSRRLNICNHMQIKKSTYNIN